MSERGVAQYLDGLFKTYIPFLVHEDADKLVDGAYKGAEVKQSGLEAWMKDHAAFATVVLKQDDYVTALTHALRIAPELAATDYGTSRQRDLGQLWTDVARGFLGEIGLARFVHDRFGTEVVLDYTLGPIEEYLPSDIKQLRLPNGQVVDPKIKVSFKTTKFNGIWLDIPGAQYDRSDVFVLVKLGISREHFVAFLKAISFVKDKLLPKAMQGGTINRDQADDLWNRLPDFKDIPCYIAGFLDRSSHVPKCTYSPRYTRDKRLKGYVLKEYVGWVRNGLPEGVPAELKNASWEFESIGTFSKEDHFVANAGSLSSSKEAWQGLVERLTGTKLGL